MRPILALAVLCSVGCKKFDLGNVNLKDYAPKVAFKKMNVENVDFQGLDANFAFEIDNPYPVGLKLASFAYDLALEDNAFLKSSKDTGIDLLAGTTSPMNLPARIEFQEVFQLVQDLRGKDEVGFNIKGKFGVGTPIGPVDVPFDESGQFATLKVPKIEPKGIRVDRINLLQQTATVNVDLGITNNAKTAAYGMSRFGYGIDLGGTRVADGNLENLSVAAGQTETVTLPITLNLVQLGSAVISAVTQKKALNVRLDAGLDVDTPLGKIPLSIDKTANLQVQ